MVWLSLLGSCDMERVGEDVVVGAVAVRNGGGGRMRRL